jgi:hypothetical protein
MRRRPATVDRSSRRRGVARLTVAGLDVPGRVVVVGRFRADARVVGRGER